MGNWVVVIHGVGQHSVPGVPGNVEALAQEFVGKLREAGQSVSDCVVTSGQAYGIASPTLTARGNLETFGSLAEATPVEDVYTGDVGTAQEPGTVVGAGDGPPAKEAV